MKDVLVDRVPRRITPNVGVLIAVRLELREELPAARLPRGYILPIRRVNAEDDARLRATMLVTCSN